MDEEHAMQYPTIIWMERGFGRRKPDSGERIPSNVADRMEHVVQDHTVETVDLDDGGSCGKGGLVRIGRQSRASRRGC